MTGYSPMMEQYFEIKRQYADCLLFYRLGDFYEMFFDDAKTASRELQLVLTGRECGRAERAPMCGVPHHSAQQYIARLVEKGYKVAVCEQQEDPRLAKKLVRRGVTRVVTRGTIMFPGFLDTSRNNYVCSLYIDGEDGKNGFGAAFADVSTGEFFAFSRGAGESRVADEVAAFAPAEIIASGGFEGRAAIAEQAGIPVAILDDYAYSATSARKALADHFGVATLAGFGLSADAASRRIIRAAGALIAYLSETQRGTLPNITSLTVLPPAGYLAIDAASRRNLELTETIRDKRRDGALLAVLDRTATPMGARRLRGWLERPLTDVSAINARLDAVESFCRNPALAAELSGALSRVKDVERLVGKIVYAQANVRDFVSLRASLGALPEIALLLTNAGAGLIRSIRDGLDACEDIYGMLDAMFDDDPPAAAREAGFIRDGFDEELDSLRGMRGGGKDWVDRYAADERERTGIKSLKVKSNKVFGYYIEITNSFRERVPAAYSRRQTLANCERFTTAALAEAQDRILGAEERIAEIENNHFQSARTRVSAAAARLSGTAGRLADMDALLSLARCALDNKYVRPVVDGGGVIDIAAGRHPVVERMPGVSFVSNDVYLDRADNRLAIITGPNMAGKSTYMRQTALIVVMAQMGGFVPADSARIGVCDRIFTRVGASDDLATGQSTFMVEMTEVAYILRGATDRSLAVLDEIGRGTSTYDGLSIARAVLEYMAGVVGAKTLFATHYHELSTLSGEVDGVRSFRVAVREDGDEVVFLRKIEPGSADNSYGIQVARLAGVPAAVLNRAKEVLAELSGRN